MGDSLTGNVGTDKNCADLSTKVLYGGKPKLHVSNLLYDLYDYFEHLGGNLRPTHHW